MPWDAASFARHNHSLHGDKAAHAARIANAVLRSGAPEGEAIAVANKWAQRGIVPHRDDGGQVDPVGSIGGIQPSAQTANPMMQQMIQRYAQLPTEKLQELQARLGGTSQGQLVGKLLQQRHLMPQQGQAQGQTQAPQQQAMQAVPAPQTTSMAQPATPYRKGGGIVAKRDFGGSMGMSEMDPWWTRREATESESGLLHGSTPGRADSVKTQAPPGSYVIPADVVAGLGEGNTLAGARVMQSILGSGPHGIPQARMGRGSGPPRPPSIPRQAQEELKAGGPVPVFKPKPRAGGGDVADRDKTPVDLSDGEFVVHPHDCIRIGNGDLKAGHRVLDKWVIEQRKKHIAKLKALPGPVKS